MNQKFLYGLKRGLPIAFGYLPVSFTFGIMAVSGGLPPWMAVFISMTNLTSAGQFAGTNLILSNAGLLEITLTTFVINIRYMLMSLSLSQRLDNNIRLSERLLFGFGITDETFSVASMEQGKLSFPYMAGLVIGPFLGWSIGTLLGAMISSSLPGFLSNSMGIALYAMFIAIIIPPAKKSKQVSFIILFSVAVICLIRYLPVLGVISPGFRVIIATIVAAGVGAYLFPVKEEA
ncbi:MAG: hypothetical protein K0S47_2482 [Herbinix sp.]|jgi:4-azaleucine resistance transporter AzlC|nr:hypothetical protein [Herbinix sp.]